jgi:uncharacterized RDD family membrane protein YckC
MTRLLRTLLGIVLAIALSAAAVNAQQPEPPSSAQPEAPLPPRPPRPAVLPATPEAATPPDAPSLGAPPEPDSDNDFGRFGRRRGDRGQDGGVVRFGQNVVIEAGETRGDTVVIGGTATVNGHITGDLVVIGGTATLSKTAVVDGDAVVVGGGARVEEGAVVSGDAVVIGGALDAPPGFRPGREQVVIGIGSLGGHFDSFLPWLSRGLLWGRLFVPDLWWLWVVVLVVFLLYLLVAIVFDGPVQRCVNTLDAKPVTAFMVGLLVLVLIGPVGILLLVSVVGIVIVPFVLVALFVASLAGRVTVAKWIGLRILRPESADSRMTSVAFAIGFAVICLTYMIPIIGLLMWAMVGVLGLGAVALAATDAYRDENPRPVPRLTAAVPPLPPFQSPPFQTDPGSATGGPADAPAATAYHGVPPALAQSGMPAAAGFAGATFTGAGAASGEASWVASATPATPLTTATRSDMAAFPRASFAERLGAFALDAILIFLLVAFVNGEPDEFFFPLFIAYRIGAWTWKSTTLGGIICQLRITRVDGTPLSFADALVRGLSSIFSIVVLGLGCFWVLKDEERQAWHDRVAGTYVVKVPRNFPL